LRRTFFSTIILRTHQIRIPNKINKKPSYKDGVSTQIFDEDLAMIISEAYQQWEEATKRRGMEQGQRIILSDLLEARFGEIDEQLAVIIPQVLALPKQEYTALLLQLSGLSREELIARFRPQ
jgi:hypothetical protein